MYTYTHIYIYFFLFLNLFIDMLIWLLIHPSIYLYIYIFVDACIYIYISIAESIIFVKDKKGRAVSGNQALNIYPQKVEQLVSDLSGSFLEAPWKQEVDMWPIGHVHG